MASARKRSRTPARRAPEQAGSGRKLDFTNPKLLITVGIILLIGVLAFFPVALATDQAAFCKSCHGMVPFYDAWAQGQHAGHATCIDCHVDAGYPARFAHKFVALGEVYAQLFTNVEVPELQRRGARIGAACAVIPMYLRRSSGSSSTPTTSPRACPAPSATRRRVTRSASQSLDAAGVLNTKNAPAGQEFVGQNLADTGGKGSVVPRATARSLPELPRPGQPPVQLLSRAPQQATSDPTAARATRTPPCRSSSSRTPRRVSTTGARRSASSATPTAIATVYCTCHKGHPPTGD